MASSRWWRVAILAGAGLLAALATTVGAVAINVATGGSSPWLPAIQDDPLWWTAGATVGVACAAMLVWLAQKSADRRWLELVPVEQRPEAWVVDRPDEVGQVVTALIGRSGATVGITTAVHGAGGFGKTTVAKLVRSDPRVLRKFARRIYWVTLGRDVRTPAAIAEKVNDLIARIDPGNAVTFTDPQQAGEHLAAMLAAGPHCLVVLDDVWYPEQEAAFPVGGRRSARLVTTRIPALVAGDSVPVRVDQVTPEQARALLTHGLPPLPSSLVTGLVAETGRWPLLLRLVNKVLADQIKSESNIAQCARELLDRLRGEGLLQIDRLTGAVAQQLDVADPRQRERAVAATIEASSGLLTAAERERLAELAVFVEDETIPVTLVGSLWRATSGMTLLETRALCARLDALALLTLTSNQDGGVVGLHDVVRDFLQVELGAARLTELHRALLREAGAGLAAWWEMDVSARYLWEHLIEHLLAADQADLAEQVAGDVRWVIARLTQSGPAAPYADLVLVGTARCVRLCELLGRTTHLLAPTTPAHSQIDVLHSRVAHDPDWGAQFAALAQATDRPMLTNRWELPDLLNPALRRTLTGHTNVVREVVVSPNGAWLATSSFDGTVRIWDVAGTERMRFACSVGSLIVSPDGTWLAGVDERGSALRVWDTTSWADRILTGGVRSIALVPDNATIAVVGTDNSVALWDVAANVETLVVLDFDARVSSVVVAPDGKWFAVLGDGATVGVYSAATGERVAVLEGHPGPLWAVVSPDGSWLATVGRNNEVWLWDVDGWAVGTKLIGHTNLVWDVVMSPDSSWIATAGGDHSLRIWDARTGDELFSLDTGPVAGVLAAPDGAWLAATRRSDNRVQVWDPHTGRELETLADKIGVGARVKAAAPDSSWLAAACTEQHTVRLWNVGAEAERATAVDRSGSVDAVTTSSSGQWLAASSYDRSSDATVVRIWDVPTGEERFQFRRGGALRLVTIAPDCAWIAVPGEGPVLELWDLRTGERRPDLVGLTADVRSVVVGRDGSWIAASGSDRKTCVWDVKTSRPRLTAVGAVELALGDGDRLATVLEDKVMVWDVRSAAEVMTLRSRSDVLCALTAAPDGSWLGTIDDDRVVKIWDTATGKRRSQFVIDSLPLATTVAPDGSLLAVVGRNRVVRVWDTANGVDRAAIAFPKTLSAPPVVSPDGGWVATTDEDCMLRIWDIASGEPAAVMRLEEDVHTCTWLPDSRSIAVGGQAGVYLFAFDPGGGR